MIFKLIEIMKTITNLLVGVAVFSSCVALAQEQLDTVYISAIKENVNLYRDNIRYYYYPNLQAYYDTKKALYIFNRNGRWVTSEKIDPTIRGYSIKNSSYVMIRGYTEDEPYSLLEEHKHKYPADFSTKRKPRNTLASQY